MIIWLLFDSTAWLGLVGELFSSVSVFLLSLLSFPSSDMFVYFLFTLGNTKIRKCPPIFHLKDKNVTMQHNYVVIRTSIGTWSYNYKSSNSNKKKILYIFSITGAPMIKIIKSLLITEWSFIWINLNILHTRMLFPTLVEICPLDRSGEDFEMPYMTNVHSFFC